MKNILLFLLIILLSTAVSAQPQNFRHGDPDESMYFGCENLIEKLDLTKEQKDKIDDLRLQHKKEMIDLKAELQKARLGLEEIRDKDNFTRSEVISGVENINKIKNEISLKAANHRMDIYEQLTDEQKTVWQENKGDCRKHYGKFNKRMRRDE
jgi:Spy/CpxP family protein refolding chaperone